MSDHHLRIEITSGNSGKLAGVLQRLRLNYDRDIPDLTDSAAGTWWHKMPDDARAVVSRALSAAGLTGRISLAEHVEGTAWNASPPPRWTGFTARMR